MLRRLACCLLPLLPTALHAQNGPPTFVLRDQAVLRIHADDVPKLLAALPESSLGRLLADPNLAAAVQAGAERLRRQRARTTLLARAVRTEQVQLESYYSNDLADDLFWECLQQVEVADVRDAALVALMGEGRMRVDTAGYFRVQPRAEGRWTRLLDGALAEMRKDANLTAVEGAKFEGFPVHAFTPANGDENGMPPEFARLGPWLLHLPGTFAFGEGAPERCGRFASAAATSPAFGLGLDLRAYLQVFTGRGMPMPTEFQLLGLDKLQSFAWTGRFAEGHLLDTISVAFDAAPSGLLPCLWSGKAPLPKQALPDGGLLQLRLSMDVPELVRMLGEVLPAGLPAPLAEGLSKALSGGVALAVGAPAQGAYVPRLFATFDVGDEAALSPLLEVLAPPGGKRKQVTYDGVACTTLQFEDLPPALQPTWCVLDGRLHIAESPLSMRAFLKAQKAGGDGLDVSTAAVLADPAGDLVPGFDLRADLGAAYRTFHTTWLPLYEMAMATRRARNAQQPLVSRSELPAPDELAPLLGTVRGELRRTGNEFHLRCLGPLGSPFAAALALAYGPMLSENLHRDYATEIYDHELGKRRLEVLWPALQAFHEQHKRWPKDLAELVVDRKLDTHTLLVPGDDTAERVPLPAGDPREVRSSFDYHPDGKTMPGNGQDMKVLLVRRRAHYGERAALQIDGSLGSVYSEPFQFQIEEQVVPATAPVEVAEPAETAEPR